MICNSKHRGAIVLSLFLSLTSSLPVYSQLRWDGGAGDGQWTTAANWSGDILPSLTDDVLLDNNFVPGNYTVSLPAGAQVITVRSLRIQPGAGIIIALILPASNTAAPALVITGPGYGLILDAGGFLRNASGITSGQSLQVADSIRINNGGHYIHQTRGSHAASIAQVLSRAPGTETGVVEFDVPGTTGYVISASARVYGTLILSANAAGFARTYSSTGGSDFNVRGNLQLNAGVSYNLNLAGNINVDGDLIHTGQSLNISSGGDNTMLKLKRHWVQSGNITETSSGLPVIELCGTQQQQVSVPGNILNSVSLCMNNAHGALLQSPVSLPYKLELVNGKITSSAINLLTLLPLCEIQADSLSHNSFIDGPLRKEGLNMAANFLFPVGKDNHMRWLNLKNASGHFTVEYFKSDPRQLGSNYGAGINHISRLEYWSIEASASTAMPALSFIDPNSGGVTDLASLRIAQLNNTTWVDAGNTAVTGTPGGNGSVTGNMLSDFSNTAKYFTLAGSDAATNPLPLIVYNFSVKTNGHMNTLNWKSNGDADHFDVRYSSDGRQFNSIGKIVPMPGQPSYRFIHYQKGKNFYQLLGVKNDEQVYRSPILATLGANKIDWLMSVAVGEQLTLTISASKQKTEAGIIMDVSGRIVRQFSIWLQPGINHITTPIGHLPKGAYIVRISTNALQFVKW